MRKILLLLSTTTKKFSHRIWVVILNFQFWSHISIHFQWVSHILSNSFATIIFYSRLFLLIVILLFIFCCHNSNLFFFKTSLLFHLILTQSSARFVAWNSISVHKSSAILESSLSLCVQYLLTSTLHLREIILKERCISEVGKAHIPKRVEGVRKIPPLTQ